MARIQLERVRVTAGGLEQSVLVGGPGGAPPVLLVHGNCSSAAYWRPLLRHLPADLRVAAPDLRGYGESQAAPVDATRGLADFAGDLAALLAAPSLFGDATTRPVVVGHSMGGGVAMQLLVDHPDRVGALLLESPVSPYGFGGTRDASGTPTTPDFAGTGGAAANPEFVKLLAAGDRGDGPVSPRTIMRTMFVADPAALGDDEEALLDSLLSTAVGEDNYPGDSTTSPSWPGIAPGTRGVLNAMSPRWFRLAERLVAAGPGAGPEVVWVRGEADAIVSDTSLSDLANLGRLGAVPGWPGEQACPPQPMVTQTRAVLQRYAAAGGRYREVAYPGVGHSPHVERPAEFAAELLDLLGRTTG